MESILRNFVTLFLAFGCVGFGFAETPAIAAKTIKVEIAWLKATDHNHKPSQCEIDAVVSVFSANGWTLQIEWGNEIAETDVNRVMDFAGTNDRFDQTSGTWHDLEAANRNHPEGSGWHFVVFGHNYSIGGTSTTSSGLAELPGDEFIVSLGSFANQIGTPWDRAATFMHELGHNLGLHHSGDQDEVAVGQYKPNYASIMSYRYQLIGVKNGMVCQSLVTGTPPFNNLDYSHGTLAQLDENALAEASGIGYGGVDWDCSGKYCGIVSQDVHDQGSGNYFENWCSNSGSRTVLKDYNDWGHIADIAAAGVAAFKQEVVSCAPVEVLSQFSCMYPSSQPDPCAAEPSPPKPSLDVVFIMDVTGSTGTLLPQWQTQMPNVVSAIQSKFPGVRFGLASSLDFPFDPYGAPGEYAYRLESPLSQDPAPMLTALSALGNGSGVDESESQYEAIYQALTGSGRDLNGDGNFSDPGEIQPCSMNYLSGNRIVLVYFTWPPVFHDRDVEPNYPYAGSQPVAGRTQTIATLSSKPVTFFGLVTSSSGSQQLTSPQTGKKVSAQPSGIAVDQLQELADLTGGAVLNTGGDLSGLPAAIDTAINVIITNVPYRTFTPESLALASDSRGKHQAVKRKPNGVDFCLSVEKPDTQVANGLHMEFNIKISTGTLFTVPAYNSISSDATGRKWDIVFSNKIDSGTTVNVCGFGEKGRSQKVSSYWWTTGNVRVGPKQKNAFFTKNQLRVPMPDLHNVGEEVFAQGGFPTGLKIGLGGSHSVVLTSYKDVQKSLIKQRGKLYKLHTLGPRCLDSLDKPHKPILGQLKNLPPDKQDNELFAEQVALKMAIVASRMGKTPIGLGELIYDDGTANPLNGESLDSIAAQCDTFLTMCSLQNPLVTAEGLDSTIHKINSAFDGTVDTISFADSLVLKGVRLLSTAPFLRHGNISPKTIPMHRAYADAVPQKFNLDQNYPNPFNPTTTIEFSLPQASLVTLKVYSLLGQEVVTLLDHEGIEVGTQAVEFDGSNFASGVYFYRIMAERIADRDEGTNGGAFVAWRKMVLLK